ncbi:MAG TPA: cytochrome C oxidase subunit IV family protein [Polyangia bacterium]|jgi:caa(3)-type oxidase subunit IV|nr:cytochrome C oxidase subunit IV family protein [Polyangia bacterium]
MSEHTASGQHSHKKKYLIVFVALTALTALEVAVAQVLKEQRATMIALLISLALVKAGCVALYYMHLADERRGLKLTVGIPMLFPPIYAVVLIIEAIARFPGH